MFADPEKVKWGIEHNHMGDLGSISKPCVMHSAAGYYIGQAFRYKDGLVEPFARLSDGYMPLEAAKKELANWY